MWRPCDLQVEDGHSVTYLLLDMMLNTGQDPQLSQETLKLVTKVTYSYNYKH